MKQLMDKIINVYVNITHKLYYVVEQITTEFFYVNYLVM